MISITPEWIKENLPKHRGAKSEVAQFVGLRPETVTRIISGGRVLKADEAQRFYEFIKEHQKKSSVPQRADEEVGTVRSTLKPAAQADQTADGLRHLMSLILQLNEKELFLMTAAAEGLVANKKARKKGPA